MFIYTSNRTYFKKTFKALLNNFTTWTYDKIKQKGMSFDHDFGYSLPLFSFFLKKREEEKENE